MNAGLPLDLIDDLEETRAVRDQLDETNIRSLAEVLDATPPIEVVEIAGGRYGVLAGYHRREAARRRGADTVRARVLTVPREQWLEHALLSNAAHGKPLTLAERKRNAARLIDERPEMSNVRVAQLAGLSDTTVAAIRPACSTSQNGKLNTREGADGRQRPASRVEAAARRELVAEFVEAQPQATVREAAAATGVSLATAADVKKRVVESRPVVPADDPVPPPFAIPLPDGTLADAGTPEADNAAQTLLAEIATEQEQHQPEYPKRPLGRWLVVCLTADPDDLKRSNVEFSTTDDAGLAQRTAQRLDTGHSEFSYREAWVEDTRSLFTDVADVADELDKLEENQ